ncbi:MAG: thrombospondin type 3 repeat-containing protein [Patescibacteria group bacterium]
MINKYSQNNNSGSESEQQSEQQPLSKKRKIAAGVLAVFGIFILVAWTIQLKNSISGPFTYKGSSQSQSNNVTAVDSEEALKTKDTDKDGLSDWDELYVYHTSPYLADSDSDGIPDGEEIKNNTDPNCPIGRDCKNLGIVSGDQGIVNQGEAKQNNGALNSLLVNQPAQSSTTTSLLGGQIDAPTLRQLLIQNGMAKDVLDKISDNDLMKSYEETLNNPAPKQ